MFPIRFRTSRSVPMHFLVFATLVAAAPGASDPTYYAGRVIDAFTQRPLAGAQVQLLRAAGLEPVETSVTDDSGRFNLSREAYLRSYEPATGLAATPATAYGEAGDPEDARFRADGREVPAAHFPEKGGSAGWLGGGEPGDAARRSETAPAKASGGRGEGLPKTSKSAGGAVVRVHRSGMQTRTNRISLLAYPGSLGTEGIEGPHRAVVIPMAPLYECSSP